MRSSRGGRSGAQRPRSLWVPPSVGSSGDEVLEVCRLAGLTLDPWQEFVLRGSVGERENGKWAAMEIGLEVSRQNGKGGVLEGRQLAGLFLFEEGLQVHTAHQFDTSLEAFGRLLALIEDTPDFAREIMRVSKSHGEEGITLRGNRRIRFRTRTGGGGRGFSGDVLYFDEAMIIKEAMQAALLPVLSARENPQIWYTGSAVDQEEHEDGVVFARIRDRGLRGGDTSMAWFGWGWCPTNDAEKKEPLLPGAAGKVIDDPTFWAGSNPGLGIRISREFINTERKSLTARNFAVERLGIGDWPDTAETAEELFSREAWAAILDRQIFERPIFAIDVSPDRSTASIGAAGFRADDLLQLELIDRRRGTGWVVDRVAELVERHDSRMVVLDPKSEAGSLVADLDEKLPFEVTVVTTAEYGQACGGFFDAVPQMTFRHGGQEELDEAVRGAVKRPLGEASGWARKKSNTDITPLVAVTLARWGAIKGEEESIWERRAKEAQSEDSSSEPALL
jgi:hypothetical protein